MSAKSGQKEESKEKLFLSCLQQEIFHLLKSGIENPKIQEQCVKRVKEFLGLPEDATFKLPDFRDPDFIIYLGETLRKTKEDLYHSTKRIEVLRKEQQSKPESESHTAAQNAVPAPILDNTPTQNIKPK